jgi:hypothetical protein
MNFELSIRFSASTSSLRLLKISQNCHVGKQKLKVKKGKGKIIDSWYQFDDNA